MFNKLPESNTSNNDSKYVQERRERERLKSIYFAYRYYNRRFIDIIASNDIEEDKY
jgi:hypothetical protein